MRKNRKISVIIAICIITHAYTAAFAQPDSLFVLDNKTGVRSLEHWFKSTLHKGLEPALKKLENNYANENKPLLERYAWLAGKIIWVENATEWQGVEKRYLALEKQVAAKGWRDTEGEVWVIIGNFYSGLKQYGKSFEYCLRGFYRFEELGFDKNPHLYRYLGLIADIYYRLGDWQSCLKYLSILNNVPDDYFIVEPRFHVQNTIALVYRNLKYFDSSAYFFKASYQSAKAVQDSFWMALSLGNLGYNYYLDGNYEQARPLLENDYLQSWKDGQYESATNAGLCLAAIYLKQAKYQQAQQVMDSIKPVVLQKREIRWMRNWFENLFGLARQSGSPDDAMRYADSALKYREMAANTVNMQILANTRSKVEAEKYLNKISLLESQKQKEKVLRNALVAGIVMVAVILLLVINRSRIRQKYSLEKAALEKSLIDEQLETVKAELNQYTLRMKEKSALLEKFEQELESLKQKGQAGSNIAEHSLEELLKSSILTEDEWVHFRELFEIVHPGFLTRMRVKLPDLTPAETRLLVLTKLKLTNKEMGAMLGIGYDAIKKTRQRLRKKIDLPEEGGLDELIGMI